MLNWIADGILAAAVLAAALVSVAARETFVAAIGFIIMGLLLGLVWIRLDSPDIALIEVAIGGGASGVLLLLVAPSLAQSPRAADADRPGPLLAGTAAALCGLFTLLLAQALLTLPENPPGLARQVEAGMQGMGFGNPVTVVLMTFRALDTLLETIVLVFALLAIWALSRDAAWPAAPHPRRIGAPGSALDLFARLLPPLGVLVGIHLTWTGADAPGGKFQGGTLIGAMWALLWFAGHAVPPALDSRTLRAVLLAGPMLFLALGLAGLPLAGAFLAWPEGWTKPLVLVIEFALTLSVAAAVAMMLAGPSLREARR